MTPRLPEWIEPSSRLTTRLRTVVQALDWTARTYDALRMKAGEALALGRSVLLDASFIHSEHRQMMAQEARTRGATVLFVECVCPRGVVLKRLATRWNERIKGRSGEDEETSHVSDGRPDLYDAQRAQWKNVASEEAREMRHLVVETTLPLAINVEHVLEALHIPHFACSL